MGVPGRLHLEEGHISLQEDIMKRILISGAVVLVVVIAVVLATTGGGGGGGGVGY
jgi:hypothetical protein